MVIFSIELTYLSGKKIPAVDWNWFLYLIMQSLERSKVWSACKTIEIYKNLDQVKTYIRWLAIKGSIFLKPKLFANS